VIRKGVAFSLMGTTLPAAVPVLQQLMEDPYAQARDWAAATLGSAVCFDGPEIREALIKRATVDEDDITRGEALHGLARRGDQRAASLLADELAKAGARSWAFEDAAKTCLGLDEEEDVEPEELITALRAVRH
jgi:HEAT repeat protein